MSKYAGFNLSKLRFYVENDNHPQCTMILFIDEGKNIHPRQTKHNVSASFVCRIHPDSEFWYQEEHEANVRAWCVKQATKLDLFIKLKEAVYANSGKGSK